MNVISLIPSAPLHASYLSSLFFPWSWTWCLLPYGCLLAVCHRFFFFFKCRFSSHSPGTEWMYLGLSSSQNPTARKTHVQDQFVAKTLELRLLLPKKECFGKISYWCSESVFVHLLWIFPHRWHAKEGSSPQFSHARWLFLQGCRLPEGTLWWSGAVK